MPGIVKLEIDGGHVERYLVIFPLRFLSFCGHPQNPDPSTMAILRTYTPLLCRFIHPSIGGSLGILRANHMFFFCGLNEFGQIFLLLSSPEVTSE